MMSKTQVPFGILFEEQVTEYSLEAVIPEYDPGEGLSYITNSVGERVPYVDWEWKTFGTQTMTRLTGETADIDPGDGPRTGTQTFTKVRGETTDKD
jgi:hypothetical protein